jgi:putative addiction module component (TIGR02574 family)
MTQQQPPFDFASLTAPERLLLAQQLVDSVLAEAMPLSPAQAAEVRLRAAAIDQGAVVCEPWGEIFPRLKRSE